MVQLLFNAISAGSLAALVASGLGVVYGILRVFNLALGQTVLMGGYLTWWFHDALHWPLVPSIGAGIVVGALLSWLTYDVFMAPFARRHPYLPIVTTIALSMMLDGAILMVFGAQPKTIAPEWQATLTLWGATVSWAQIVLCTTTAVLLGGTAWMLGHTRLGRQLRATAQHHEAAGALGIRADHLQRILVIVSGTLACAGGVFIGIDQNLTPTLAFPLTIKAYAAVIAGGMGNLWGTVACAFGIALIEQLAVGTPWWFGTYIPAGYQSLPALVIIIAFLLWKPEGLFGHVTRRA